LGSGGLGERGGAGGLGGIERAALFPGGVERQHEAEVGAARRNGALGGEKGAGGLGGCWGRAVRHGRPRGGFARDDD
jgi:hypothetical protein